jgi:hypothetical protein
MEAPQQNQESLERADAPYEAKRQEGYNRAQTLIENIEGYEQMDYREKFGVLSELLKEASDQYEEDYIAAHMYEIEQQEEKDKIDADLSRMRQHYQQAA